MRQISNSIALCAVLGAALGLMTAHTAGAQTAADWAQFQGPTRDGISRETGLLSEWPENGPALLWTATGLGKGFSSVAITGGRIFTMGDITLENGDAKQCIIALDLATQKRLWATPIGGQHPDGQSPGPRCTPTVVGTMLYALGSDGDLVCAESATGKVIWKKNLEKDFGGRMMSGWKWSESPLVDGDKVVVTPGMPDAIMVALNRKTGETIWTCKAGPQGPRGKDGAGYSSIVAATIAGVKQYVQMSGHGLIGVSAADGKFLWNYDRPANNVANITAPVVKGNMVFGTSAYGAGSGLVNIAPVDGGFTPKEVYFLDANTFNNHHGGMVLVGGYLYGGHGQNSGAPCCIEFASGKVAYKGPNIAGGSAAVAYADGHIYYFYDSGVMALVEASSTGFKLSGKFSPPKMDGAAWAHPVILGGKLFLRHDDALFCYNIKK